MSAKALSMLSIMYSLPLYLPVVGEKISVWLREATFACRNERLRLRTIFSKNQHKFERYKLSQQSSRPLK